MKSIRISLISSLSVSGERTGRKSDRQSNNFEFHIVFLLNV